MNKKLSQLLKDQGIKNVSELSLDERKTFETWESILSGNEITVDKIIEFCKNQVDIIEDNFKNLDNSTVKLERLVLLHSVYKTLYKLITAPKVEKENLEHYLHNLLTPDRLVV